MEIRKKSELEIWSENKLTLQEVNKVVSIMILIASVYTLAINIMRLAWYRFNAVKIRVYVAELKQNTDENKGYDS